jgi:hypothetical protein
MSGAYARLCRAAVYWPPEQAGRAVGVIPNMGTETAQGATGFKSEIVSQPGVVEPLSVLTKFVGALY